MVVPKTGTRAIYGLVTPCSREHRKAMRGCISATDKLMLSDSRMAFIPTPLFFSIFLIALIAMPQLESSGANISYSTLGFYQSRTVFH